MFTETEDNRHMDVVVLGADLKNRFFPNVDPIGKTVQVDGRPFQVVGVAKSKGSVFGQSQDNFVSIPIQTYVKIYGARSGLQYNFSAIEQGPDDGSAGRDSRADCALPGICVRTRTILS